MKKYIIIVALASFFASLVTAQGLMDVSKYGTTDIMGTARYMAMGGSMGALGGDPSAILDNPAALGIYRSSEFSFTLNATPSLTRSVSPTNSFRADDFFFNFNQMSYVVSIPTRRNKGYVSSNFSFTYNRLKDFHRTVGVGADGTESMTGMMADISAGFGPSALREDNEYAPYMSVLGYEGFLIDPMEVDSMSYLPYSEFANRMRYKGVESGRIDEYNLSYAANVGHYLYLGAGIGMQTLNYTLRSSSGETMSDYLGNDVTSVLGNVFSTAGFGCNVRVGVIVRPVSFMRVGLSFQSPTWYAMTDRYEGSINTVGTSAVGESRKYNLPRAYSNYDFNSPLKVQASLGFVLGKFALINLDYQFAHNRGMKLIGEVSDDLFQEPYFRFENDEIKSFSKDMHLVKVGAEFRIASQFSIRGGFAYRTPGLADNATRSLMDNTTRTDMEIFADKGAIYGSGGLGYRYNGFGIDLTYAYSEQRQGFSPFQRGAELLDGSRLGYFGVKESTAQKYLADVITARHNIVLSLSYKF